MPLIGPSLLPICFIVNLFLLDGIGKLKLNFFFVYVYLYIYKEEETRRYRLQERMSLLCNMQMPLRVELIDC